MSTTTAFGQPDRSFRFSVVPLAPAAPAGALGRKLAAFRALELFASASDADLQRLAESSLLRRFERGRTILRSAASEDCVILVEGRAKTTMPRGVGSGEFALGILEAGAIVSTGCWAEQRLPELGDTVAMEASAALFLPRRALEVFLSRNSRVALQFLAALSTRLRGTVELAARNSCLDVGDRLYAKLVELSETRSTMEPRGLRIEHGLYQSELAAGIGASREAVNRQLAEWRDRGLLESGRRYVLVTDVKGLAMAVSSAVRERGFHVG